MIYIFVLSPLLIATLFFIKPQQVWLKSLLTIVKVMLLAIYTLLLLRVYWLDIYKIPSGSMEQTLMIGDKIIIKKDELPQHSELVVFQMKDWKKHTIMVKRCMGLPGDTLSIRLDSVFVNNNYVPERPLMQWAYNLDSCQLKTSEMSELLLRQPQVWSDKQRHKFVGLTRDEHTILVEAHSDLRLPQATLRATDKGGAFPWKGYLKNNRSNIKPFYVPRKGKTVPLNKVNRAWYGKVIKQENLNVVITKDEICINNLPITSYTFKHSYYYMMGDNRNQSSDSRGWGFVREEYILGKALIKISSYPFEITKIR